MLSRQINIIIRKWKGNPRFHLALTFGYLLSMLIFIWALKSSSSLVGIMLLAIVQTIAVWAANAHYSNLKCKKGLLLNKLFGAAFLQQFLILYMHIFTHFAIAFIGLVVLIDLAQLSIVSCHFLPNWQFLKSSVGILLPCYLLLMTLQVLWLLKNDILRSNWQLLH